MKFYGRKIATRWYFIQKLIWGLVQYTSLCLGEIKTETWKRGLWVKRKVKCKDNSSAADISLKYNFLLDTSNIKSKEENLKIGKLWDLSRLWVKTLRSSRKSWHKLQIKFQSSLHLRDHLYLIPISGIENKPGAGDWLTPHSLWMVWLLLVTLVMKHNNDRVQHWPLEPLGARTLLQSRK